jgi:hypothetical protein
MLSPVLPFFNTLHRFRDSIRRVSHHRAAVWASFVALGPDRVYSSNQRDMLYVETRAVRS